MTSSESEFSQEPLEVGFDFNGDNWVLPSDAKLLGPLTAEIEKRLQRAGWSEVKINNIVVTVTEAFNNGVRHGNKDKLGAQVYMTLSLTETGLVVTVRDDGPGIPPDDVPDPLKDENLLKEGGRGRFLMKQLSQRVEFAGSQVTLHFLKKDED